MLLIIKKLNAVAYVRTEGRTKKSVEDVLPLNKPQNQCLESIFLFAVLGTDGHILYISEGLSSLLGYMPAR